MKVIDFTHIIKEEITVYPGTELPQIETVATIEKDGFKETALKFYSHVGTHMDAPAHVIKDGYSLDEFKVEQFVGKALVIRCGELRAGEKIHMERINAVREKADEADFLLFHTGWDRYWGQQQYLYDYPLITEEVAEYIIESKKKGFGIDTISIDSSEHVELRLHHKILSHGKIVIMENLTELDQVGDDIFTLCALPLKYENSDGAPARVVGIEE